MVKSVTLLVWIAGAAIAAGYADQGSPAAKTRAVGLVGHWTETQEAGEPVLQIDGTAQQTPSAAEIEKAADTLFGRLDPGFAANTSAPGAFALAVLPDVAAFTEGSFRARFRLVSGASDQTAGLVFNLKPNGEYLYARYNTKDGNLALWRYANGARQVIAHGEQHIQVPLGVWHELGLTIAGTRLVAVMNDSLRFEHQLERPVEGRVGFWTKRDSVTMFKDIRVTARTK